MSGDGNIIEQLRSSVELAMKKTGTADQYGQELLAKIQSLQDKFARLPRGERAVFTAEMEDSFRSTIDNVEKKLVLQQVRFGKVYHYSILTAVVFLVLIIIVLFGYKLYKSLMEKELKKKEKLKSKQSKKTKKAN